MGVCPQSPDNSEVRISQLTIQKIKMAGKVELYTTDFALDASGASYKGLIVVNKVKSRNMFADIGAGFKSMVGGEIKSMSKLTRDTRNELIEEACQQATQMGANAITGIRLETNTIFDGTLDMVLYGTAVSVRRS